MRTHNARKPAWQVGQPLSLRPLGGLPLRFCLLQGWDILTNFKVPVLADTLYLAASKELISNH